ncbi:unnamed protein product [Meloidogyne enterolobii]|uniref:Uncharacterized protein n=2 Tax=Meloidogyne enterolobii TaxID=390850 RepID=A0ACB0Y0R5_MELEN
MIFSVLGSNRYQGWANFIIRIFRVFFGILFFIFRFRSATIFWLSILWGDPIL